MEKSPGKDLHNNSMTEDWNISSFAYSKFEIQEELVDTGIEMETKPFAAQQVLVTIDLDKEMESRNIDIKPKSKVTDQSDTGVDLQKTILENVNETGSGPKATFRLSKVINTVIETEVTGYRLKDEPDDCVMEETQEELVDTGVEMEPKPVIVEATFFEIEDNDLEEIESNNLGIESKDLEIEIKSEEAVQSNTELDVKKTFIENVIENDIAPKEIFRDIEDSACSKEYVRNPNIVNKDKIAEDEGLKRAYYEDFIKGYVPENPAYLEERKKRRSRAIQRKSDVNKTRIQSIINNGPRVVLEDIAVKNTTSNALICNHCYEIFPTRQELRDHIYFVVLGQDEAEHENESVDNLIEKLLKIPVVVLEDVTYTFPALAKELKRLSPKPRRNRKRKIGYAWIKRKRKWNPEGLYFIPKAQVARKTINPTVNLASENGVINRNICPVKRRRRKIENKPQTKEIRTTCRRRKVVDSTINSAVENVSSKKIYNSKRRRKIENDLLITEKIENGATKDKTDNDPLAKQNKTTFTLDVQKQVKSAFQCVHCDYEFNSNEGLRLHVYDVVLGLSYIQSDWKKVFGFALSNSNDQDYH